MKIHKDLNNLPEFRRAVVTIGSFDGVHTGHQQIIDQINTMAHRVDGESVLITFHPHPRLVVYPNDKSLKLITTIDEKVQFLERYEVDHVVIVPFSIEFSQQSADEYIQKFLVGKFNPYAIVIGYDHRFGAGRQGDINYLRWHSEKENFKVVEIEKQEIENIAVSSTKIRTALESGQVAQAANLMQHFFTLTGTVVQGQKIGTDIGFPTANIEIPQAHKLIPPTGIYAVNVLHAGKRYGGMLYIGDRPTLKEYNNRTIEVNIFDFNQSIYGDKLQLELVDFVREDAQYDSLEALSAQLARDKEDSLRILQQQAQFSTKKKSSTLPSVAVAILNYNGQAWLERFLPSILDSSYENFSIYVADNGSTDGSLEFLRTHYPQIKRIDLEQNYGYAGGYNHALKKIDAEYYVLLNSDIEVAPNWIEPIIELMERDKTVGACQPKIRAFNQREYFEYAGAAGGWIDRWGYPFCRGRIFATTEKDEGQYDDTQEIFWATGAALFIRARLFHSIGGFDADYFAHAEEIDLCWRLKRAGYKVMVRPRSVVYHVGGGTLNYNTPRKTYLNFRNTLFTIYKNEPTSKIGWLIPLRLVLDGLAAVLFLTQGRLQHIKAIVEAHWSFFGSFGTLIKKKKHFNECIRRSSISTTPNQSARYRGSIVWDYYGKQKRLFKNL